MDVRCVGETVTPTSTDDDDEDEDDGDDRGVVTRSGRRKWKMIGTLLGAPVAPVTCTSSLTLDSSVPNSPVLYKS